MRATQEKKIREQLVLKRREANEAYRRSQAVNREATGEPLQDLADQASEGYRKEFLYSLSDGERATLMQVEEALRRLDEGSYESDGIHETWWRVDGRVLSQSSIDLLPTGQSVAIIRRSSPPWLWGVTDQSTPSMPGWMKDDAKWQAALDAQR